MSVFEMVLAEVNGDKTEAGIRVGRSLMKDEPERFKAGYTADNAALAVRDLYGLDESQYADVLYELRQGED